MLYPSFAVTQVVPTCVMFLDTSLDCSLCEAPQLQNTQEFLQAKCLQLCPIQHSSPVICLC